MEKILRIFEPKHYRYIISGLLIFWINHSLFLEILTIYPQWDIWMQIFVSSEIALLISFPIHKYFTFLDRSDELLKNFIKFILIGSSTLMIRYVIFYIVSLITQHLFILNSISIGMIVLLNFVLFDRIIFNPETYEDDIDDPYKKDGSGIETLETIEEAHNYNLWLSEKFENYLGNRNLELGAGRGTLSAILSENYQIDVFEISEDNYKFLKDRFSNTKNIQRIDKDYLQNKEWNSYDCIFSSNVLEHIQDDEHFILHGMQLLKTGGKFVAIVPAMKILYSAFDKKISHIRRYTRSDKKRIQLFLERNKVSYVMHKYSFFNPVGAVGWFIKMKIMKNLYIKKSDAMTMNALIPFISILDYLPLPFGQSILFVIEKK